MKGILTSTTDEELETVNILTILEAESRIKVSLELEREKVFPL